MYTSCPRKLYSKYNKGAAHGNFVLDRLFKEFAKSAYKAYNEGVPGKGERTFCPVFLGVSGDHPFQTKVTSQLQLQRWWPPASLKPAATCESLLQFH